MKALYLIILLSLFSSIALTAQQKKYRHILITNDDGIEDADRLLALGRSVARVSDRVSIVVASYDRSGTSNHTQFGKHRSIIEVECRYTETETNLAVYTLSANPADCILIGLGGLFGEDRPQLVLSGINGGSNIGPGWFGSGTIGAVRTAAFLGVKAIALSGFDDDYESSFEIIPDWITKFIEGDYMDLIGRNDYLTIGFPKDDPSKILGVKVVEREVSLPNSDRISFKQIHGEDPHNPENLTAWALDTPKESAKPNPGKDISSLIGGFITITPMSVDENQQKLLEDFKEIASDLPKVNR